jgi:hypothetical protein
MEVPAMLPHQTGKLMTTGDGFETWLQYVDGFKLRHFYGFELINDPRGCSCLRDYHRKVVEAAVANGFGVISEGLHYRANRARRFPHINIWGCCCSTDGRHIGQIARQVGAVRRAGNDRYSNPNHND